MDVNVNSDCQEIVTELRTFITGASRPSSTNQINLVRTAVSLLKTLPAAREAVLEYFGVVFLNYIQKYLDLLENGTFTLSTANDSDALVEEDIPLIEIQNVLCNFIRRNSEAWAPIISTWSLALLGDISSRYVKHKQVRTTLNERLQLWTTCAATRILLDLNTQCMSCLMNSNTEACITALLEMSVVHNPHFNWVIVHIGCSFPETVVNKVLTCGLKDFCANEEAILTAKLNSVVGILGHLAGTHSTEIRKALDNLFKWSLLESNNDKNLAMQKTATVPYLLQLANKSSVLLKALSADTLLSLNMDVLVRLSKLASDWWCYFENGRQGLLDLVVHLLLNLDKGIYHVLTMLFETSSLQETDLMSIALTAQEVVELLMSEMNFLWRTTETTPPLIRSFYGHMPLLKHLLLSDNSLKSSYAMRLFIVLGKYNRELVSSCVAFLLNRATTEVQIERLIEITASLNDTKFFAYAFCLALQYKTIENIAIIEDSNFHLTLWKNVHTLLKYELRYRNTVRPVLLGLTEHFRRVLECLKDYHCDVVISRIIASLIQLLLEELHRPLKIDETLVLIESVVLYFYSCLVCDTDSIDLLRDCQVVHDLLAKCSLSSSIARNHAIRILIETALYPPVSPIFGAIVKPDPEVLPQTDICLLKENIKQGSTLMVAQSAMSVFHAGIIGSGLREIYIRTKMTTERVKLNTQHLISAVRSCCLQDANTIQLDAVSNLALLLVQLISPDVMFNGLPWPEEEFCKVTVERDLCIRRIFDSTPLLWSLLKFVAMHRPALCYCSVLLRAITATLITQWSSASQGRYLKQDMDLVDTSITLLEILSLGQLLPPPLSGIRDVVSCLSPQHVLLIFRECVWNYMRDHVPSPALFTKDTNGVMWRDPALSKPTKQYTETLRVIMLNDIEKLGDLYNQLFTFTNNDNPC